MDTRQLQINTGSSASKLTFYQHHYFLGSKLASNFHNSVRYEVHRNKFLAGLCLDLMIQNCNLTTYKAARYIYIYIYIYMLPFY